MEADAGSEPQSPAPKTQAPPPRTQDPQPKTHYHRPVNALHRWYCNSERWARVLEGRLDAVLQGFALGDDVLELGPGPGVATDWLRDRSKRVTSVEIDASLAQALRASPVGSGRIAAGDRRLEHLSARLASARSGEDIEGALALIAEELQAETISLSRWRPDEEVIETVAESGGTREERFSVSEYPLTARVLREQGAAQVLVGDAKEVERDERRSLLVRRQNGLARSISRHADVNPMLQPLESERPPVPIHGHDLTIEDDGDVERLRPLLERLDDVGELGGFLVAVPGPHPDARRLAVRHDLGNRSNPVVLGLVHQVLADERRLGLAADGQHGSQIARGEHAVARVVQAGRTRRLRT